MTTDNTIIDELAAGNDRFVARVGNQRQSSASPVLELVDDQSPIAAVLCCSDARVPPDRIFDQPLGALFVARVAGNVAQTMELASLEYAVDTLGVRLILVLGHTQCGAVTAAARGVMNDDQPPSPALVQLIDAVKPSVHACLKANAQLDERALVDAAVRVNVGQQIERVTQDSPLLDRAVERGDLSIAGGVYSLENGRVDFLEPH